MIQRSGLFMEIDACEWGRDVKEYSKPKRMLSTPPPIHNPHLELLHCAAEVVTTRNFSAPPPSPESDVLSSEEEEDVFILETEEEQAVREAANVLSNTTLVEHFQCGEGKRKRHLRTPSTTAARKRRKEQAAQERWHTLFFNIGVGERMVQLCAKLERNATMAQLRYDIERFVGIMTDTRVEGVWQPGAHLQQIIQDGAVIRVNFPSVPNPLPHHPQSNIEYERFETPSQHLPLSKNTHSTFLMFDRNARNARIQSLKLRLVDIEEECRREHECKIAEERAHPHLVTIMEHLRDQMHAPQFENADAQTGRFEDPEYNSYEILRGLGLESSTTYLCDKMLEKGLRPPCTHEVGCLVYSMNERKLLAVDDYSVLATQMYSGHVALRVSINKRAEGAFFLCARIGVYMSRSNVFFCGSHTEKKQAASIFVKK